MKRFSKKNRVYARVTASIFALMLLVLSACESFVVPTLQRPASRSNAYLTKLVAQWTDENSVAPSFNGMHNEGSFTAVRNKGQTERFTLGSFDEDVHLVRITITVSNPDEEVIYETVDKILYDRSARTKVYVNPSTGVGVIDLNMLYRFDTNVFIFVGHYAYTICIQKMVKNNRIYVSKYGDGSGSGDDTTGGELRGYTPDTAFFSLKNAIARGAQTDRRDIYIVGELDNDPEVTSGDAVFVIANTDHRFRIWDGGGGSLKGASGKRVVDVINADVAFIDIGISGGNAEHGGGVFVESSRAAFLRCNITGNTASDKGGAVYLADKIAGRAASSVTINNTAVYGNTATARDESAGLWAGSSTKLSFEDAQINDNVYFAGDTEVGSFLVGGSTYFGKAGAVPHKNAVELADIVSEDYGALVTLATASQKVTLAGNIADDIDAYGLAAFINTPAQKTVQVLYEASGSAARLAAAYRRFRVNNALPAGETVASLRAIDENGKITASRKIYVRTDGSDLCDGLTEGSAFKSFEYGVFTANLLDTPHLMVKGMLTSINHYTGALNGWTAADGDSVFTIAIPAAASHESILIEGVDASAANGFSVAGSPAKRALKLNESTKVMLKNLNFTNSSTMAQNLGSAFAVAPLAEVSLWNVTGAALGVLNEGALSVIMNRTTFGKVLLSGSASASIEGILKSSFTHASTGAVELTGIIEGAETDETVINYGTGGSFTMKEFGRFRSTGKIKLAQDRTITIDGVLEEDSLTTKIEPYQWTIDYSVLSGNVTAGNSGRFAMSLVAPRDKWAIDASGKLAHTATDDPIGMTDWHSAAKPKISGNFYLGADYITIDSTAAVEVTDNTPTLNTGKYIYAVPSTLTGENILNSDPYTTSGNVTFVLGDMGDATAAPTLSSAKGGWYKDNKRAVGTVYRRESNQYLLKLDLIANASTPVYTRVTGLNTALTTPATTYKYSASSVSYDDAYYFVNIKGGDGGRGGMELFQWAYPSSQGAPGGSGSMEGLRGTGGIRYGIGAKGATGGPPDSDNNEGGGGGGGGDTWIKGSGGYIIARGGVGAPGRVVPGNSHGINNIDYWDYSINAAARFTSGAGGGNAGNANTIYAGGGGNGGWLDGVFRNGRAGTGGNGGGTYGISGALAGGNGGYEGQWSTEPRPGTAGGSFNVASTDVIKRINAGGVPAVNLTTYNTPQHIVDAGTGGNVTLKEVITVSR